MKKRGLNGVMIKFKIRGVSYACNEQTGECTIIGAGWSTIMYNPIEAFNTFWQMAGYDLLREIRDAIEKNGFNRYTGVKYGKEDVI